jgi:hypothetical protein
MEQNTMEQLMEFMKAQIGGLASDLAKMNAKMDSNQDKTEAERKADKEESKANQEGIIAEMKVIQLKMDANRRERKAHREEMRAEMDAWLGGVTHACLEKEPTPEETEAVEEPQKVLVGVMEVKEEPAPEETEVVAERQEVPKGATDEETIGAAKDQSRDLRLAVRCRGRLKTRTKRDGRLKQECAATVGRPTRRFAPALRKGGLRKGPGKKCRSSIRRPGRTFRSRIDGRSLKQRQTKNKVVQETPEGRTDEKRRRTRPECNSGIRKLNKVSRTGKRGRIVKRERRLDRKKTYIEAIRKRLCMEIIKLIFESSIGLREPRDGTLWKCRPLPKRKR